MTWSPKSVEIPFTPGYRVTWGTLYGSALGLALSAAVRQASTPLVVITEDTATATRLERDILFYLGQDINLPVLLFPDWETLPYDLFSPHQDLISTRLSVLSRLSHLTQGLLLVPVETLMQRLPPPAYLEASTFQIYLQQTLPLEQLRIQLETAGYRFVNTVMERGEFTVHGRLFDVYPMGAKWPCRLEFRDEKVHTLRTFETDTQRTRDPLKNVTLLPAREFPLDEIAIERFKIAWHKIFVENGAISQTVPIYRDVARGLAPAGIEYYLPLFFEKTATLFDYISKKSVIVSGQKLEKAADACWQEVKTRYEVVCQQRPLLPPSALYLQTHEVFSRFNEHPRITFQQDFSTRTNHPFFSTEAPPDLPIEARAQKPLWRLLEFLDTFPGRILIAAESTGRREALKDLFASEDRHPVVVNGWQAFLGSELSFALTIAPIEQGLILKGQPAIAIITEHQIFGEQAMQRRRRDRKGRDAETVIRDLTELHVGAPVIHEAHGVGRYLGLQRLTVDDVDTEFLTLEYAGGDKLYVPVASLHLVNRYTGIDPEHAPLHKLGSPQWEQAKRRAAEQVRDVAAELLDLQAQRAARPGHAFSIDHAQYRAFSAGFPFETTPDQQDAINATLTDLTSGRPMDRVICGDVGFGKTEVALRAAFVVAFSGYQVALLVPTTLLAQQHYQTLSDRFAGWPIRIEVISRFRSKKEQDTVLTGLRNQHIDIVIGTHKLLQAGVVFKNLGLVIIDEEHRFGVRQKEAIKALRTSVDLLTLTATPIPRTLHMALSGIRAISVISTPPARRLAIQTFVRTWDTDLLREALLREVKRGGQVYFLHNEVSTIEQMAQTLSDLLPEATIQVAHGQMNAHTLERVMLDFYHQRFNVLVCSTIIETGIDVPTANTLIINRADRFGLAQLYQLRGRVGRSHHRAYAYLIVPERQALTPDAIKRLEAIESLTELGVGYTLANHDLEIRGAGEMLGESQSGQMQEIGFSLYQDMLTRAVASLKSGHQPTLEQPLSPEGEVDLHLTALIPQDYLPDVHTRLILYKRIASAATLEALNDLHVEMIDRFGLLPDPVKQLFEVAEIKRQARLLGIKKFELNANGGRIVFHQNPQFNHDALMKLIQTKPWIYQIEAQDKVRITASLPDAQTRLAVATYLMALLSLDGTVLPPPPKIFVDLPITKTETKMHKVTAKKKFHPLFKK